MEEKNMTHKAHLLRSGLALALVMMLALVLGGLRAAPVGAATEATSWLPASSLSDGSRQAIYPDVVVDSNDVAHVVYSDTPDFSSSSRVIYVNNRGGSWSAPKVLFKDVKFADRPRISTKSANGKIYIGVVMKGRNGDAFSTRIYYRHSVDGGASWRAQQIVTNVPSYEPALVLDNNGKPHVIFSKAEPDGQFQVYYTTNPGTGWTAPVKLSNLNTTYNNYPAVGYTLQNGVLTLHVLFMGQNGGELTKTVFYTRKIGAAPWTNPVVRQGSAANFPDLVTDRGSKVYATWQSYTDQLNYEAFYSESLDNGTTWSSPTVVGTNGGSLDARPAIGRKSGGALELLFDTNYQSTDQRADMYHRNRGANETSWSGFSPVFRAGGQSLETEVAGGPYTFVAVWHDSSINNAYRIFVSKR
jgi:hypothetical protein